LNDCSGGVCGLRNSKVDFSFVSTHSEKYSHFVSIPLPKFHNFTLPSLSVSLYLYLYLSISLHFLCAPLDLILFLSYISYISHISSSRCCQVERLAGQSGVEGFRDGNGRSAALFGELTGIAVDPLDDTLFVCDYGHGAIRAVAPDGSVYTLVCGDANYTPVAFQVSVSFVESVKKKITEIFVTSLQLFSTQEIEEEGRVEFQRYYFTVLTHEQSGTQCLIAILFCLYLDYCDCPPTV
jgi:hypothetical protein